MNFLKTIKNKLSKSLENNVSLSVYAIIIAIITWFVISMTLYPSIPKTLYNIPLDLDITGTNASNNGLSLISCDVESVNVRILGNRAQIGNLTEDNLTARIVADNVSTTGTKTLSIEITCDNKNIEFEVEDIFPETATVVFDKYDTREFDVVPDISKIKLADGKIIDSDNITCEPDKLTITGPSAQLDKISQCVIITNSKLELDSSYTLTADEIKLFSEDGATIEKSPFKFANTNFMINVPVLTHKKVGLSVGIAGAPDSFDVSSLKFKLSADSITLASTTSNPEFPTTFEVGKIQLSDLDLGFTQTFTINTMDYKNISSLEKVTVTLDDENLASKEFIIDNFNITNAPDNYDFDVTTTTLTVNIVGPEDVIAEITSSDIVADINLLNATLPETNSFNWDVTISFPKHDNVWAVTRNKVILTKEPKETSSEEE